ncbi:MAG: histidine phosphatase family protein [Longicatena sp.]
MKKTLYLMRHGQTLFNARRKIQGVCDSPLTPLGIQQAQKTREYLKDINFDHLYCSTAERTSDTLEIVTDNKMAYTRLKGLKEMNFGVFEGESEDLNPAIERYETFFLDYGGESRAMVKERMMKTCSEIMEKDDHKTVLAVSHGGACVNFLLACDPSKQLKKRFSNCGILVFEYENKKFTFVEAIEQA